MNSHKKIGQLMGDDTLIFMKEPEEVWEAISPEGVVLGEIKTTWEYYFFRAQIKDKIHKDGYKLRKKSDVSKVVELDSCGRRDRGTYDHMDDDFSTLLDYLC